MLKRPTQAQIKGAAASGAAGTAVVEVTKRAEELAVHPLVKACDGARPSVEQVVRIMNGSPFNRDAALLAIACLEGHGFSRDVEADKARGDKTVLLVNDGPTERLTIRLKPVGNGERFGCYMDAIAKKEYRVKVRQYMTKPATADFDFMDKYNDGNPMPMRVMFGTVLEETRGMYRMALYGKPEPSSVCFVCGRTLTHPVSVLYGIGPECGEHYHINPLGSAEALKEAMESIKKNLADVRWTGWVIKKAIEDMEEVEA